MRLDDLVLSPLLRTVEVRVKQFLRPRGILVAAASDVDTRQLPSCPGHVLRFGRHLAVEDLPQQRFGGDVLCDPHVEVGDLPDDGHVFRRGCKGCIEVLFGQVDVPQHQVIVRQGQFQIPGRDLEGRVLHGVDGLLGLRLLVRD